MIRSTASSAVTSSVSAVPPTLVAVSSSASAAASTSTADHLGAVAGEHLGDGGADTAGRAGDHRDLAVQRLVPVRRWGGVGGPDVEHLAVDVCRLRRQEEPQRGLQARGGRLGVGRQVHQRHGRAVLHLLAQRAGEALQRALGDALVDAAGLIGRRADHHDASRRPEIAQQWGEELVQRLQARRCGDTGGVEHQPAERVGPPAAEVVADRS